MSYLSLFYNLRCIIIFEIHLFKFRIKSLFFLTKMTKKLYFQFFSKSDIISNENI